jgi:hypothetical protein
MRIGSLLRRDDIGCTSTSRQAAEDCEDAERYRFAKEDTKAFENYFGCGYHEIDAVIDTARTQEKARD